MNGLEDKGFDSLRYHQYKTSTTVGNFRPAQARDSLVIISPELAFNVYPNPNSGSFEINIGGYGEKTIAIIDIMGKTIYENKTTQNNFDINLPSISKGIYFVKVLIGEKYNVKKLIIE